MKRKVTFTEEQIKFIQEFIVEAASSEDAYDSDFLYESDGYNSDSKDFDLEIEIPEMKDVLIVAQFHACLSGYYKAGYTYWDDGLQMEPSSFDDVEVEISGMELMVCDMSDDAEEEFCEHNLVFNEKEKKLYQNAA